MRGPDRDGQVRAGTFLLAPPALLSQFLTRPAFPVKWGESDHSPAPPQAPPGLREPLFSREVPVLCSDSQLFVYETMYKSMF